LITNGDLLTDALYRDLRESGLDALGVSIYDNKTAERMEQLAQDERLALIDMRRVRPPQLENRAGNVKRKERVFQSAQQYWLDKDCKRPSHMMTVNAKGQVALCCSDMYSDVVMGDVATHRLEQIWNNESFQRYRTHLAERGRKGLALCESCSFQGTAPTVHYPLDGPPGTSQTPRWWRAAKQWWRPSAIST
jgi:radical SAM protein with 4Fe4S-binding SPASM domain